MCPTELVKSIQATHVAAPEDLASIPSTELCRSAYQHAASILHPSILAHSMRLYIYTKTLAASAGSIYSTNPEKHDHLFVACLFHDIGTTETYNGEQRFEVEGADAAVAHLAKFGVSEEDRMQVWYTIALHTSKGIVHRMGELPALMRRALDVEFSVGLWTEIDGIENVVGFKLQVEEKFPRQDIEKVLGDAVTKQAVRRPEKAPGASWPGDLLKAYREDPGWQGINKGF